MYVSKPNKLHVGAKVKKKKTIYMHPACIFWKNPIRNDPLIHLPQGIYCPQDQELKIVTIL